jgi:hypothetical protein
MLCTSRVLRRIIPIKPLDATLLLVLGLYSVADLSLAHGVLQAFAFPALMLRRDEGAGVGMSPDEAALPDK